MKYRDQVIKVELDRVFDSKSTQLNLFEGIRNQVIKDFFRGVSSTLLAYGQTGSGKKNAFRQIKLEVSQKMAIKLKINGK